MLYGLQSTPRERHRARRFSVRAGLRFIGKVDIETVLTFAQFRLQFKVGNGVVAAVLHAIRDRSSCEQRIQARAELGKGVAR